MPHQQSGGLMLRDSYCKAIWSSLIDWSIKVWWLFYKNEAIIAKWVELICTFIFVRYMDLKIGVSIPWALYWEHWLVRTQKTLSRNYFFSFSNLEVNIVLHGFYKEFQFYIYPKSINLLLPLLSWRKQNENKRKIKTKYSFLLFPRPCFWGGEKERGCLGRQCMV